MPEKKFVGYTTITALFNWWSIPSFFFTIYSLITNINNYLSSKSTYRESPEEELSEYTSFVAEKLLSGRKQTWIVEDLIDEGWDDDEAWEFVREMKSRDDGNFVLDELEDDQPLDCIVDQLIDSGWDEEDAWSFVERCKRDYL